MTKYSAENERIKHRYLAFLKQAKGQTEHSVDVVAKSLARFEEYNDYKDFKRFHHEQAVGFKKHLAKQHGQRSDEKLSKATLHATLNNLKVFFQWLSRETGYKSRIEYSDAEYFNLPRNDEHIATARREKKAPTMEQVKQALACMPHETDIERRNRALVAFTLLTAARVNAMASMKLKHVDLIAGSVYQDARDVHTKFRKTFPTFFFPVGDEIKAIVEDWVKYLRVEKLWGNDDPLFPATRIGYGASKQFEVMGLDNKHWGSTTAIRTIFKEAFEQAGLPYFHPHSFRHTLTRLGQTTCQTPEAFTAWSQNLGHNDVMTTLSSYGAIDSQRQAEIIKGLANPKADVPPDADRYAEAVVRKMREAGMTSK